MNEHKLPRSPMRVGLIAFGLTILIGLVIGLVGILVINPGGNPEKRGELLGQGLAPLSMIVGAIAYFVQRKRTGGGQL
jgi:drug/metabolite transporter (DMT)-like permease